MSVMEIVGNTKEKSLGWENGKISQTIRRLQNTPEKAKSVDFTLEKRRNKLNMAPSLKGAIEDPILGLNQDTNLAYNSFFTKKDIQTAIRKYKKSFDANDREILYYFMDKEGPLTNGKWFPGQLNVTNSTISDELGISPRFLSRRIARLEKMGIIKCRYYIERGKDILSLRRQINFQKNYLMISVFDIEANNPLLSSVLDCISSDICIKRSIPIDPYFSATPQNKELQPSEPEAPQLQLSSDNALEENKEEVLPDSYKRQVSRLLQDNYPDSFPPEEEMIPPAARSCPEGLHLNEEKNMNIFGNIVTKEELARIEAEKDKERYARIEKQQAKQKEESHVFTKHQARKERLQNLETLYPNYKEVCEKEGCDINELKRRMWFNWLYEPFDMDTSNFNPFSHPSYGFMSEEEKDREFVKVVNEWIYPAPYRHSRRNLQLFHKARLRADELKITYQDWFCSIYWGVGERNMRYSHINSRFAEAYYTRWIKQGKPIPRKSGESKENVLQLEKLRKWKNSKPRYKKRDSYEMLSQQVDPLVRVFAAEYAAQCASKRTRV